MMSDFEIDETEWGQRQDPQPVRNTITDLRGASRMVFDAITGITGLVEAMHTNIAEKPARIAGATHHSVLARLLSGQDPLFRIPTVISFVSALSLPGDHEFSSSTQLGRHHRSQRLRHTICLHLASLDPISSK
jgi:hypothetical protein